MSLPIPDLDDRRFQDLVDEAKRMIPQLVPEWTNHNVADPGVALIELFAWMSEQVIFRLNQVPEKLYVQFLDLLGTAPFPASAARAPVTFWLSGIPDAPLVIPRGTEVTTEAGGEVFATVSDLPLVQPALVAALTSVGETAYVDVSPALGYDRDSFACFRSEPAAPGDALNLGFDVSLARQMLVLEIETAGRGIGVDPDDVPIVWEAWTGEHWVAVTVVEDDTGGLNRSGTLRLVFPDLHESLVLAGQRAFWVRVRLVHARTGQPSFATSPRISALTASCLGGTVMAEHSVRVGQEVLGVADGTPQQTFELQHRPVMPRDSGEHVVVTTPDGLQTWAEVSDFGSSGPDDRHVVFDDAEGVVTFGPSIRQPDGTTVQHGALPPYGSQISITGYRTGGGAVGNVAANTLTALRQSVPYVIRVSNLVPAKGGVDAETIDEVKLRGPRSLRTGRRAVTPSDYEQLTLEATPKVARALCVPSTEVGEPIRVLVVPANDQPSHQLVLDDFALTEDLYRTVADHLDDRRPIGAQVVVTAPYYQGVSVVARVRASAGRVPAAVSERVVATLGTYLSPLVGGALGEGWPFGTDLHAADLTPVIEQVPGVDMVDEVVLFEYDLRNEQRLGDPVQSVALESAALFLSGRTQVVVR